MLSTYLRLALTTVPLCLFTMGCHRPAQAPSQRTTAVPEVRIGAASRAAHRAAFWTPGRAPGWGLPSPVNLDPRIVLHQLPGLVAPGPGAAPAPLATASGHRAATFARLQHGKRYCWGGNGPDCFDCSGLTSVAWKRAGTSIPRTSTQQRQRLPGVPMGALAEGDILWRPGHVGMYVGDGWAIHAPGRGKRIQYQRAKRFHEAHRPVAGH
jgi:hypothetical protein